MANQGRSSDGIPGETTAADAEDSAPEPSDSGDGGSADEADKRERVGTFPRLRSVNRSAGGTVVDSGTEETVRSGVRGGEKSLPTDMRSQFESSMDVDFSDVSIRSTATSNAASVADLVPVGYRSFAFH